MERKYNIDIKWLAVTCFEFNFDGLTVVTDPFITDCVGTELDHTAVENCDVICLSHSHWDHITDIPRLTERFSPIIMCGDQTAMPLTKWLNYNPSLVYPMYPDTEIDLDKVKIRALYGKHKSFGLGFNELCARTAKNPLCINDPGVASMQPYGHFEYRNFLFTTPNGTRILLWGNDPTVAQLNICKALKPHIAIIQRSSNDNGIVAMAEFAAGIGAEVVIPHHQDFRINDDPVFLYKFRDEFLKRAPDKEFIIPSHGEWIRL